MNTSTDFDTAARRFEQASIAFSNLEVLFFEDRITVQRLREAWDEKEQARRDFERLAQARATGRAA